VEGPITAMCPGSVLQLHQHATIVVDADAASELALADYYVETYANLPDWQRLDV
jgi:glucosamine-6-phosphate deaminase